MHFCTKEERKEEQITMATPAFIGQIGERMETETVAITKRTDPLQYMRVVANIVNRANNNNGMNAADVITDVLKQEDLSGFSHNAIQCIAEDVCAVTKAINEGLADIGTDQNTNAAGYRNGLLNTAETVTINGLTNGLTNLSIQDSLIHGYATAINTGVSAPTRHNRPTPVQE